MSLPHAILGFLQVMPLTGYDLKTQAFDRTVAFFWPASLPQIYRELERMEEQGWVESHIEVQQGRPNRKVYQITHAGEAELRRWLTSYQPPPIHREPFLIRLYFGAQLTNGELGTLLEQQAVDHRERLAALEAIEIPNKIPPGMERRRALSLLTRELGLRYERMYLEWLERCLRAVAELDDLPPQVK